MQELLTAFVRRRQSWEIALSRPFASGVLVPRLAAILHPTTSVRRIIWILLFFTAISTASFALESHLKVIPLDHASWGANEGAPWLIYAIAQTSDDYLWIGAAGGLYQFDGLIFKQYQTQSGPPLPAHRVLSLLALPNRDLWIGFNSGAISLVRNGHAVNYGQSDGVPKGQITCLAQDRAGTIWAGSLQGLVRLENNRWKKVGLAWNFPRTGVRALYLDRAGTLWVATEDSFVFLLKGARRFQATGIHVGQVAQIAEAPNGKLWMAETTRSVRPIPLHTKLAPSDETEVQVGSVGILFAREGDLWITTLGDGLRRVLDPEKFKDKIAQDNNSIEGYTVGDGLSDDIDTSVFQDRAGNIWVGADRGLDRFRRTPLADLKGLSRNPQPQPPSIRSIVIDGRNYLPWTDLKQLPAGIINLQIRYTAAGLENPPRVRFRYRLDGVDAQWRDAGSRRTADYTNLGPGRYQFRVLAGDMDGIWSSNAAEVDFTIPPLWFQATWFQMLCGTALLAILLWVLYQLRMRQLKQQFSVALGARVDERMRIARELHDTLLQSFHGLMFQVQAARNLLPQRPESAVQTLDEAILATEQALAEGRDAIHDLRPEPIAHHDLEELLTTTGQELAIVYAANGHFPNFRVIVEGKPQRLFPTLQDEIYRIAREVIRNAFHHAFASRIEVEIRYDKGQLRLRIRDNGKGIDPKVMDASGRSGHWGLPGIRERAQRIGARMEFWSEVGAGTEVELRVSTAIAYEKQRDGNQFQPLHPGGSDDRRS